MKPEEMKILVVGDRVWGKGDTIGEALAKMKGNGRSKEYVVFVCHPETRVDPDGFLNYPMDFPPKEIDRKGSKK